MLSHIIAVENFFRIKYLEKRELSESEKAIIPALEPGKNGSRLMGKPLNYYKRELAISHKAMLKALKNMTNQKLLEARYDIYDYVNGCNLAWILYHGAEDEVYHRGQISLLRKLYQKMKGNK
jgi:uncharacterized damage-inducible protein DinB